MQWLASLLRRRQPQSIVVRTAATPTHAARTWRRLAAAGVAVLAVGAAIPLAMLAWRGDTPAPGDLPIAPAVGTAPVRVVSAAYVPAPVSPAPADTPPLPIAGPNDRASPPLPFEPPAQAAEPKVTELPREAPVPAQRAPAAPTKAIAQEEPTPAPKVAPSNQREQQPVSALVLDEAAPRAARAATNPPTAVPAQPARAPAQPANAPVAAAAPVISQAPAKPALERGKELIAITPDGKVAVFTNPQTRLPQQFKIGDQLPSEDAVRSIDAKEGKVVSSPKE